jgi:ABC-2 type transport system permease protein
MTNVLGAWSGELRAQSALFMRAARTSFAYKPALVIGMLTVGISYVVPLLVWRHIYAARALPLAVPASQLFPYLLLAASLNFVFLMGVESRVGQRIRLGLIATDLLRPVDFQLTQLTQALSDVLLNVTMVLPFVGLSYALWGHAALPHDAAAFLAFLASAFLALLIQFAISFIFVQTAFITFSNYGVFVAKSALQQTFSGISAPLALFPPTLRAVAERLPFCQTIHTPVSLYLGTISGPAVVDVLLVQAAWAVGLLVAGRALLGFSLRYLEIQGG